MAKSGSYHHGDLKNAALEAAEALLGEVGPTGLSLREVARRIGVSHAALYRHYPDKQALLVDLAREGFEGLHAAMLRAAAGEDGAPAKLRRLMEAYLAFARRHTPRFRLMYGPELAEREKFPPLREAADASFNLLVQLLEQARAEGALPSSAATPQVAASAFAMSHGLSVLTVNGLLRAGDLRKIPREELVDAAWSFLWKGIGGT